MSEDVGSYGSSGDRAARRAQPNGSVPFTPGPWKATIGISETDAMRCGVTAVRGKTEYLLATIENGAPGDFCETEVANAHLTAAAPEMYAACLHAETVMMIVMPRSHSAEYHETLLELKAALAKARGDVKQAHDTQADNPSTVGTTK